MTRIGSLLLCFIATSLFAGQPPQEESVRSSEAQEVELIEPEIISRLKQELEKLDLEFEQCAVFVFAKEVDEQTAIPFVRNAIAPGLKGHLFFVDEKPDANWSHPASLVVIGSQNNQIKRLEVQFPPRNLNAFKAVNERAASQLREIARPAPLNMEEADESTRIGMLRMAMNSNRSLRDKVESKKWKIYVLAKNLKQGARPPGCDDEITAPGDSILFVVTPAGDADSNWPTSYFFLSPFSGTLTERESRLPHSDLAGYLRIELDFDEPEEKLEKMAILFSGGLYSSATRPRYWRDLELIFTALKQKGFTDDEILVAFEGGIRHIGDLDGDGVWDIDFPATFTAFSDVLQSVKSRLRPDGVLICYTTNHGNRLESCCDSSLCFWTPLMTDEDDISDSQFSQWIAGIECHVLVLVMQQCYAGAMVEELAEAIHYPSELAIFTACGDTVSSIADTEGDIDEFTFHFGTAVLGRTLTGQIIDADFDSNGTVTFDEIHRHCRISNSKPGERPYAFFKGNSAVRSF